MHLAKLLKLVGEVLGHWKTSRGLEEDVARALARPIPGAEYVHTKTGNRYTVLCIGVYCGKHVQLDSYPDDFRAERAAPPAEGFPEGKELVVYVGHYDNKRPYPDGKTGNRFYVRPIEEWLEEVTLAPPSALGSTYKVARFEPGD